jgi:hypothetical protein
VIGNQFLTPPDQYGLLTWLAQSPLSPGDRVRLKADWEYITGESVNSNVFPIVAHGNTDEVDAAVDQGLIPAPL